MSADRKPSSWSQPESPTPPCVGNVGGTRPSGLHGRATAAQRSQGSSGAGTGRHADAGQSAVPILNLWFIFKTSGELLKMDISRIHPELGILRMTWSVLGRGGRKPKTTRAFVSGACCLTLVQGAQAGARRVRDPARPPCFPARWLPADRSGSGQHTGFSASRKEQRTKRRRVWPLSL